MGTELTTGSKLLGSDQPPAIFSTNQIDSFSSIPAAFRVPVMK